MPTLIPHITDRELATGRSTLDDHPQATSSLLGTDDLVAQLRSWIPGDLSKRTVYQWCDLGCPHIVIPGQRQKLAFVLDEVMGWVMSHRGEKHVFPPKPRRKA